VAKDFTAASLILGPVDHVFIRVIPKEVSNESAVWHIRRLGQICNVIELFHALRDTAVHAHDFLVHKGDERHVVEAIVECLPEGELVPSLDLVKEAVNAGDSLTFVVTAQHNYLVWEANLKRKKEADDLAALLASVHIIA